MTHAPKLKICGLRDAAFARRAEDLGVDYLGFIFADGSPRRVTPDDAARIAASLAGRATCVGVFTDAPVADILAVAARVPLAVAQLHSEAYTAQDAAALKAAGLEVWRLHRTGPAPDWADALLLDGFSGGRAGGTGTRADWTRAADLAAAGRRVVLAGGISAANAAAAAATGCAILDVNSSLETAPGVKSIPLLEQFFAAVNFPLHSARGI